MNLGGRIIFQFFHITNYLAEKFKTYLLWLSKRIIKTSLFAIFESKVTEKQVENGEGGNQM